MTRRDNVATSIVMIRSQVVGVTLKVSHICSDELDIVHEDLDDNTDGEGLKEGAHHKIWQECRSMEV